MSESPLSPVTNKRRNFELWSAGVYGNRLRAWRSVAEWRASGFSGKVALRVLGWGDGCCTYNLSPEEVEVEYGWWLTQGERDEEIVVCEMPPDDRLILNGEYHHDPLPNGSYRHLFFSRVKKPMRVALREGGMVCEGHATEFLLREHMTPSSWSDFIQLAKDYPFHVVEFSVYDHCLGCLPRRNTLMWEVRRY